MFRLSSLLIPITLAFAMVAPAHADQSDLNASFDTAFGTEMRAPTTFQAIYETSFEAQIAELADGTRGRIGVYAVDLATGDEVSILGDMRFPMASTSKVAVAATFLAGVDEGKYSLTSEYPLQVPVRSKKFSSDAAPVKQGNYVPAHELIGLMISKSCNSCTDALIKVVGGTDAVNKWVHEEAGIKDFELSRTIATLVRDDGEFDPVEWVDPRDSATPRAMGQLLAGLHQGRWLSAESRAVLMAALEKTTTGRRRMNAALPEEASLAHKTGTLSRTASDIGIFRLADGRAIAAAIYVTGQSANLTDERRNKRAARARRDARIADITRALYTGFSAKAGLLDDPTSNWTAAPDGNRTGG
ncbi:MAG: serine hydrolase [Erythrobacter sp.]|uniref:serine hydrolase n=1 Tax=Erythrobacter sp. TaxID=1042 RepID=UPI00262D8F7B|nr:serine hydrolase [Erythrobacter sp.]MDJ0979439.1 serine hydrolase [Erythrobacter sp.]